MKHRKFPHIKAILKEQSIHKKAKKAVMDRRVSLLRQQFAKAHLMGRYPNASSYGFS